MTKHAGVRGCVFGAWRILCDEGRLEDPTDRFPYGSTLHAELDAAYDAARKDVDDLPRVIANTWLEARAA